MWRNRHARQNRGNRPHRDPARDIGRSVLRGNEDQETEAAREQVRTACEKNDDNIGYGAHAKKGGYGCVTDNGFIDCKENGACTGGIAERRTARHLPRLTGSGKLVRR
ncbi:hypothetical protein [Nitratireductor sp. StC3]|uniref:hypothetical protein n=1 Tax=Nitratireductor sp. StC3 TaxID=2126741 RepID=UPI000D0D8272|nr:hypothetical protein [Nitratireductor sp. StC3]PSM19143.1 hypothetical protein C7T96_05370 [Nitratireductor sp. StC3]